MNYIFIKSILELTGLVVILPLVHTGELMKFKRVIRKLYDKVVVDEVNISLALLVSMIILVVMPTAISGLYGKDSFLESWLASINAIIIDLLFVGIFLKVLGKVGSRRREIQQYLNEIDDFRSWKDQIAAHRIRGNIIRLNKLGTSRIDLNNCYLADAHLAGVKLIGSNLWKATFERCDLENSELRDSDLWNANLTGAVLRKADLSSANLDSCSLAKADMSGANLKNACLKNTNLLDADLTDSVLDGADLTGVKNLTPVQLSKATSAVNIRIEHRLLEGAKRINPALSSGSSTEDRQVVKSLK